MKELLSAWAAFTDPGSPWYYVVSIIFLALIFAALAVFIFYTKRHKKPDDEKDATEQPDHSDGASADGSEQKSEHGQDEAAEAEKSDMTDEPKMDEPAADASDVPTAEPSDPTEPTEIEAKEEPADVAPSVHENIDENTADTEAEALVAEPTDVEAEAEIEQPPAKPAVKKTTSRSASGKPAATKTTAGKKSAQKKSTAKPFIDRLIDTKSVHSVYNELKNTILSYPGVKAKLTKEGEAFYFGEDKKAWLELADGGIMLRLAVDPATVPEQFGATATDGELPTALLVVEEKIDGAQKLIFFAMNVAMLTRNANRRYVDYVQNAVNAKRRAAAKKK